MGRAMKDSGVEWIGEIPEDWKLGRIGEIYTERRIKVSDAEYPPLSVTMKGIVPQLSTAAKTDAHDDRKLVCKGDFAINSRSDRRGSCGISAYDGSVSLINTILKPRKDMNPRYYDWLFHTTMFADEFYKWGHGIVDDLWTTNWQDMKNIFIPIPSINEQEMIAASLDAICAQIDATVEKTRTSIEEYKHLKQAVITQAVTKGVRGDRPMKESGIKLIGQIPINWKIIRLKYLTDIIVDCPHETPNYCADGPYYVVRTADEDLGFLRPDENMYRLDEVEYQNRTRRLTLDKNDIVYGREGERWGLACLIPVSGKYCLGQRMMQFRCNRNMVHPEFVMYALNSKNVYLQGAFDTIGSTSPHVNISTIINYSIPIPPMEEQLEIASYLNEKCVRIDALVAQKEQLLSELESYKKALIYEYVTGKKETV